MLVLQGLTKVRALTYNYVIIAKGVRGAGDRTRRGGGEDRKGKESDWKRVEIG